MCSRITIVLLFTVLFSILTSDMDAYRFDTDQPYMNNPVANSELIDPYLIQRLQILLAAAEVAKHGKDSKDSTSSDHKINTRLTMHRRPGLIRLRKSN
jgi:hypothetical protein